MSKGLEALKRIKPYADSSIDGELDIIEKELKALEELQKLLDHERELNNHLINHELKALEIIKNEKINVECLMGCFKLNVDYHWSGKVLEKEKYDLLKEVLL